MKTLFVLESPLQTHNALQYIEFSKLHTDDCHFIYITAGQGDINEEKILTILEPFPSQNIARIYKGKLFLRKKSKGILRTYVNSMVSIINSYGEYRYRKRLIADIGRYFKNVSAPFQRAVFGDYRYQTSRQILAFLDQEVTECILLDDGAITPEVMEYRRTGKHEKEINRSVPAKGIWKDPFSCVDIERLTFFSIYDELPGRGDAIIHNSYYDDFDRDSATAVDEVWICGTNHVEAKIAAPEIYMAVCKKAVTLVPAGTVRYFPHRREDPAKLAHIADTCGLVIEENATGIENIIATRNVAPTALISFGSTVLDTVSRMLSPKTSCLLFIPPPSYFIDSKRNCHLLSVIRNNITKSKNVTGLFYSCENSALRAKLDVNTVHEVPAPPALAPLASPATITFSGMHPWAASTEETCHIRESESSTRHGFSLCFPALPTAVHCEYVPLSSEGIRHFDVLCPDAVGTLSHALSINLGKNFVHAQCAANVSFIASGFVDEENIFHIKFLLWNHSDSAKEVAFLAKKRSNASVTYDEDPDFGVAFHPKLVVADEACIEILSTDKNTTQGVVQLAATPSILTSLRLYVDGAPIDIHLLSAENGAVFPPDPAGKQYVLQYEDVLPGEIMKSSTPVLLSIVDGALIVATNSDSVTIERNDPNSGVGTVGFCPFDPYTKQKIVLEYSTARSDLLVNDAYVVAM